MEKAADAARIALEIGYGIISTGGEVSRAEDSAKRVSVALGMERCDVFALNTFILITVDNGQGELITLSRRIKNRTTDLGRLEKLNELSRELCDGRITAYQAEKRIKDSDTVSGSGAVGYAVSMAVCAVFTLFFGGGWREAVSAALSACATVWMKHNIKAGLGNAAVFTFVCSIITGACGAMTVLLGFAKNYEVIAKGNIMLLVPGLSLVCSGRDIIGGDMLTGLLGFIETVIIAVALAAGFALPELLFTSGDV